MRRLSLRARSSAPKTHLYPSEPMPLEVPAAIPEFSPSNASAHAGGGAGDLEKPKSAPGSLRGQFSQELWDLLPSFSYLGQGADERQEATVLEASAIIPGRSSPSLSPSLLLLGVLSFLLGHSGVFFSSLKSVLPLKVPYTPWMG